MVSWVWKLKTSIGENWSMSVCIFSYGKCARNDVKTRRNATLPVVISTLQRAVARWYIGRPSLSFKGRISRAAPRSDSDLNDETCTTWDSVFSLAKTSKKHLVASSRTSTYVQAVRVSIVLWVNRVFSLPVSPRLQPYFPVSVVRFKAWFPSLFLFEPWISLNRVEMKLTSSRDENWIE